jgi:hypothetical protein
MTASLALLEVSGGSVLQGPLSLVLEATGAWTADRIANFGVALKVFVDAGAMGGYRAVGPGTTPSSLAIASPPAEAGSSLYAEFTAENVEPRSLQYLRHQVARLDLGGSQVVRIFARELAPRHSARTVAYPAIDDGTEEDLYPEPITPQPFAVEWSDVRSEKSRRLELHMGRTVMNADVDEAAQLAGVWGSLLEGGAFALPAGMPGEVDSFLGAVTQFDRDTIEIEIPVYQASEAGWDVLLNLIATARHGGWPVVRVVIE